jgi:hypothetical protein
MRYFLCYLAVSFGISVSAQNHKGVILDAEDGSPIEFVSVYNQKQHQVSNEEGKFDMETQLDSLFFFRQGYHKRSFQISKVPDTVLLEPIAVKLDEVVVTNGKDLFTQVKLAMAKNYDMHPHKERFFIRSVLRRNDTLVRLQDMVGKLKRKTLLYRKDMKLGKKDFTLELEQMRKAGIKDDDQNIYFKFPTLYQLLTSFVRINATGPGFTLTEMPLEDSNHLKLEFINENPEVKISGFYLIDTENYAILEFHLLREGLNQPYRQNKWLFYKDLNYQLDVYFALDQTNQKYYLKNGKSKGSVSCTDADRSFKTIYEAEYLLDTTDPFSDFQVKKNVNVHKDLFKIRHTYEPTYWQNQNRLLLTQEMQAFIDQLVNGTNEFKVKTNLR